MGKKREKRSGKEKSEEYNSFSEESISELHVITIRKNPTEPVVTLVYLVNHLSLYEDTELILFPMLLCSWPTSFCLAEQRSFLGMLMLTIQCTLCMCDGGLQFEYTAQSSVLSL